MSEPQPDRTGPTPPSLAALQHHFQETAAANAPLPAVASSTPAGPTPIDLARLRAIAQSARLLGYDRIPMKRSVHHLVWLLTRDIPPAVPAAMPVGTLHRVLVIRTAPLALLERLVDSIRQANPDASITVLCHQKDVPSVARIAALAGQEPLVYPRLEPYTPATLAKVLATAPTDWDAVFALDNSPSGRGRSISHVWSPFGSNPGLRRYVFNASAELFCEGVCDATVLHPLASQLLEWLDRQSPEA